MKQLIKIALLLLAVLFNVTAWGQTTIEFIVGQTVGNNTTATGADEMTIFPVKISTTSGGFNCKSGEQRQYRFAKNSDNTIETLDGSIITEIKFTCIVAGDAQYGPGNFQANGYTYEDKIGTWTGSASKVVIKAVTAQVRATMVEVTIMADCLVHPSIKPVGGTYSQPVEVSINCGTNGADIYYTTNGNDPTISSTKYTVPFILNSNTTVKAISAKDGETSDVVTATYEFPSVTPVANIREYQLVPDETVVTFTNPVNVLAQSGQRMFVMDNTGYALFYGIPGQTYENGDVIPAGFMGTKFTDEGEPALKELKNFQPKFGNSPINPEVITPSQVGPGLFAHFVRLNEVTFDKDRKLVSDGLGMAPYYCYLTVKEADIEAGVTYEYIEAIVGSYGRENTIYQIIPTSIGGTMEQNKFEADGLWYLIKNDNDVYVTSCQTNEYSGNVIIPDNVSYLGNTYQVVGIDAYAFNNCANLNGLSIPVSISNVSSSAFSGSRNIDWIYIYGVGSWTAGNLNVSFSTLYLGQDVTSIPGLHINPSRIYSFAPIPPSCDSNTFTDYSSELHVPASSLAAYFMAPYWSNFGYIAGNAVEPISISINTDSMELRLGEQFALSAIISPNNATPNDITWKSSNPSVAIVNNGIITAMGLGECDIISQCLDKKSICHIVVIAETIVITLDQQEAMVLPNHIIELIPSATPTMPDLIVTSNNPTVAAARIVDGIVQVVGIIEGFATITVGSVDGAAIPATCMITVYIEQGDINKDGYVNVGDVTDLISYILGNEVDPIVKSYSDINGDDVLDVLDVSMLINLILSRP